MLSVGVILLGLSIFLTLQVIKDHEKRIQVLEKEMKRIKKGW